ncbi:MAG TPA: uroporphyrinogen-III synthase [Gammaproteobacteria bacterium]
MSAAPLAGRRILLTRSAEDCAAWRTQLERLGAEAVALPCIAPEPIDTPELRRALADALQAADWLVFTSKRGVEGAVRLGAAAHLSPGVRTAAVGAATAEAVRAAFGPPAVVGTGTGERLADALVEKAGVGRGLRVVLAVATGAGTALGRRLAEAGAEVTRLEVYRTVAVPPSTRKVALSTLRADAIVLASPSAVTGLLNQVEIDAPAAVYTIGPTTSAAARASGLNVTAEAAEPSFAAVLEAIRCRN